jgi:hypothetical protein
MAQAVSNIDHDGVTFRLRGSVLAFATALAVIAALRVAQTSPVWFLVASLPFFAAFWLTYQGLFKTCTYLASHGLRDVGDGKEAVCNLQEVAQLRAQGRSVLLLAGVSSAIATSLAVVVAIS